LKNSKLIFGAAVRARLIGENPFKGISTQLVKRPDRMAFIDRATIHKVLDACPSVRWKAIVVLCRFGGLRCPSELFALRWADVDFDRGRMNVRSPKGANFGKGIRETPLFPEVRQTLEELYLEPDGGEFVISTNDRSSQKNLRTVFEKILRKAGVDAWQRLFQNLRASRETELAQEHAIHLVTAWLGNTPKVAMEHNLQVRDEDFDKAAQIPAQQPPATHRNGPQVVLPRDEQTPDLQGFADRCHSLRVAQAPRLGLEPRT
jgi:integrase